MRGRTPTGGSEILNMGTPNRSGYGYIMTEFKLYFAQSIGTAGQELTGSVTADTVLMSPVDPDFNNEGLIATAYAASSGSSDNPDHWSVVNDLFVITQNLILAVRDSSGNDLDTNWQCKFKEVKLTGPGEAVANYKQYTIYNTSS